MLEQNDRWLEQYPEDIPASIDYPDITLPFFLEEAAKVKPNQVAIRFLGKSLLYQEVYEQALSLANALLRLGVKAGDRVALMLANCPQAVIGYYGILLTGAIVVPTNPLYMDRELEQQLNDAGVEVIIGLDLVYPKISRVRDSTPLKHVIVTSIKDYLPFPKNLLYPFVQKKQGHQIDVTYNEQTHSFVQLIKKQAPEHIESTVQPEDLAVLQYTGGTTGVPKGVMLTHRNLVVNTYQCNHWFYKSSYGKEKALAVVPFFHVYGMTVVMNFSILAAATMILIPKFEPEDVLKAIHKEKPTIFPGAPTIYIGLLNHPELNKYNMSSIEACISGSAPLPIDVQKRFEQITRGRLVEGYGLTEASPVTHANLIWGENVIGSIGLPWPDTQAKIVSMDTLEEVPVGQIGELAVKGPQVMKGYWNKPEETAKVLKDGWLLTGDMGYMDKRGYFYIVDRKKDMILAGGYNIYPREIEEVLYEHWGVQECVVVGVSDAYRGETVKAYIVKQEGRIVSEEELDRFCREKLAAYKVPKIYEFRDELPKSMVGKILRRVLVEEERQKQEGLNEQEGVQLDSAKQESVEQESIEQEGIAQEKNIEQNIEQNAGESTATISPEQNSESSVQEAVLEEGASTEEDSTIEEDSPIEEHFTLEEQAQAELTAVEANEEHLEATQDENQETNEPDQIAGQDSANGEQKET